jgi:uncharacterized membrane protein
MISRDFAVRIRAPVEKVFAYTTDFRNFVQWQDGIIAASQAPDGSTGPGTTFTLTRTFLGRRIEAAGAVTEFIPNQTCAFKTTSGPIQISLTQAFEADPAGTLLRIHLDAEPGGFFKLAEAAIDRQVTSAFEAQIEKLKVILES